MYYSTLYTKNKIIIYIDIKKIKWVYKNVGLFSKGVWLWVTVGNQEY